MCASEEGHGDIMDLQKSIRIAVETGKTKMGSKEGKILALKGGAKLLLVSSNCPKQVKEEIVYNAEKSNVKYYETSFTSMEIGSICGKPFPVSVLSIIDPGNSDIMKILENGVLIEVGIENETKAAAKKRSKEKKKAKGEESTESESKESEGSENNEGKSVEAK